MVFSLGFTFDTVVGGFYLGVEFVFCSLDGFIVFRLFFAFDTIAGGFYLGVQVLQPAGGVS